MKNLQAGQKKNIVFYKSSLRKKKVKYSFISIASLFSKKAPVDPALSLFKPRVSGAKQNKKKIKEPIASLQPLEISSVDSFKNTDFFKKAFGSSKENQKHQFLAPLFINKQKKKRVLTKVIKGEVSFQADFFSRFTQPLIQSSINEQIIERSDKYGFIKLKDLNELGFETSFNSESLYLSVEIPAVLRRHQTLNLRRKQDLSSSEYIVPADFSSYLNYYLYQGYSKSQFQSKWNPFRARFESIFNLNQCVLENNFVYSSEPKPLKWRHLFKKLSYDF
ncbi:hypothetical protein AB751O23_CU_00010, partial [Chlamydiales bacterium SCGC AB-751-O23]